jgi:hypothetical protein
MVIYCLSDYFAITLRFIHHLNWENTIAKIYASRKDNMTLVETLIFEFKCISFCKDMGE